MQYRKERKIYMQIPNVNLDEYNQRVVLKVVCNNVEDMNLLYDGIANLIDELIENKKGYVKAEDRPTMHRYREIDEEQVYIANTRILIEAQAKGIEG